MKISAKEKESLKNDIIACLSPEIEIKKIIVFGSFTDSGDPVDIDIAVFQDSNDSYLPLAMKYRKLTRKIAAKIPLDVIPINIKARENWFLSEIKKGEMIYER